MGAGYVDAEHVGHGGEEVHCAHGMTLDGLLLQNGLVGLAVPVRSVFGVRIRSMVEALTALLRLPFKVMLSMLTFVVPSFLEKVSGKVVSVLVASDLVQAEESQLDLGMARISVQLIFAWSKSVVNQGDVFLNGLQEKVVLVVLVVG